MFSLTRATCRAHLFLLEMIALITPGENYKRRKGGVHFALQEAVRCAGTGTFCDVTCCTSLNTRPGSSRRQNILLQFAILKDIFEPTRCSSAAEEQEQNE